MDGGDEMPLDSKRWHYLLDDSGNLRPQTHTLSPAQARTSSRARVSGVTNEVLIASVEDRLISGQAGVLTGRVYTPIGIGPFPILVWFHGGGWVTGDLEGTDEVARMISSRSRCVVISVDYRLAPETKFPGPVEDCYAATIWVSKNAEALKGDPSRIAVGGSSAGGNLAAAVCLMSRDRREPRVVFQLLVYPVLDRDFTTKSYGLYGRGEGLSIDTMAWYWKHYLMSDEDAMNPYAAPLRSEDFSRLPQALIMTAEFDPLCDEAEVYSKVLNEAGVIADYRCYQGMVHGFFGRINDHKEAERAMSDVASALQTVFSN